MLSRLKSLLQEKERRRAERIARQAWTASESQQLEIDISPEGIVVRGPSRRKIGNTPRSISWQDIDRAFVFKRDRMTVDDICMAFESNGRVVLEINEEMIGWRPLIAALPEHLEGVVDADEWFAKVVRPAFAPCTTLIYDTASGIDSAR